MFLASHPKAVCSISIFLIIIIKKFTIVTIIIMQIAVGNVVGTATVRLLLNQEMKLTNCSLQCISPNATVVCSFASIQDSFAEFTVNTMSLTPGQTCRVSGFVSARHLSFYICFFFFCTFHCQRRRTRRSACRCCRRHSPCWAARLLRPYTSRPLRFPPVRSCLLCSASVLC